MITFSGNRQGAAFTGRSPHATADSDPSVSNSIPRRVRNGGCNVPELYGFRHRITHTEFQQYPGDPIRVPDRHSLPNRTADIINMDQPRGSDGKVRVGRNVVLSEMSGEAARFMVLRSREMGGERWLLENGFVIFAGERE